MRIAGLLIFSSLVFGLAGLFFGRSSWIGMKTRSIPVWLLLEAVALILLIIVAAIHFQVSWTIPLRY